MRALAQSPMPLPTPVGNASPASLPKFITEVVFVVAVVVGWFVFFGVLLLFFNQLSYLAGSDTILSDSQPTRKFLCRYVQTQCVDQKLKITAFTLLPNKRRCIM